MARKLKSDRVLFIATILLVGLSIVMVYSASAVVALERYQRPYLFLTKQIMWAVLGIAGEENFQAIMLDLEEYLQSINATAGK